MADMASRSEQRSKRKGWVKKGDFHPAGEKGKLHREMGIPEGEKIPAGRLKSAEKSKNPEIRRDAIRAKTMEGWNHSGKRRKSPLYDKSKD